MFVIFPYADDNPRKTFPVVTVSLIALNSLIFFVFGLGPHYEVFVERYGFTPEQFSWLTLLTSMFLHAGIFHLVFNMWFLWLFGDNLEDKLGSLFFLGFYLLGGIAGGLMHSFMAIGPTEGIPCIGASGAVSAVMGGYIVFFPRARIRMLLWILFWARKVKVSALFYVGLWFAGQYLAAFLGITTGVAYGAHLGGIVFGVIGAYLVNEWHKPKQDATS